MSKHGGVYVVIKSEDDIRHCISVAFIATQTVEKEKAAWPSRNWLGPTTRASSRTHPDKAWDKRSQHSAANDATTWPAKEDARKTTQYPAG